MAVMRVEKNSNYTVMANYHLRDKRLSLKAKGLLSVMISLPSEWDYTLAGLAYISKEGVSAIRAAIQELEENGYPAPLLEPDSLEFSCNSPILHHLHNPLRRFHSAEYSKNRSPRLSRHSFETLLHRILRVESFLGLCFPDQHDSKDQLGGADMHDITQLGQALPDYSKLRTFSLLSLLCCSVSRAFSTNRCPSIPSLKRSSSRLSARYLSCA